MAQFYSDIDDEIGQFFLQASATRAECDNLARTRFGGPVEPVSVQGATSYTVVVGPNHDKIVQFRGMDAQLDMRMLDLARQVHGDVVPAGAALGHIGDDAQRQLAIYEMDRLPGDNYAMAWRKPVAPTRYALSTVATELSTRLDDVSSSGVLTARFGPAFDEVREQLPALASGDFPMALTHSDLNELNILVDGGSGIITGIVDWNDAGIQPFGLTLYALEKFIGSMGRDGWVYLDNADALGRRSPTTLGRYPSHR
ncbi:hypothetical protein KVR01_002238 [Diaporthe batatas]|uniref:uncharacterized protein n=1 Tax=Diaporthe batatas TaxID=748121 RepID=UPI001D036914|nr:uncharacterized protein KVR01_002238 [Diaporthe batatas]KAG8166549.1 hypothetical protein KVR01_002238 [Diaporthe batatas]